MAAPPLSSRTVGQTGCSVVSTAVPPLLEADRMHASDIISWRVRACEHVIGSQVPDTITTSALTSVSMVETVTICDTLLLGGPMSIYLPDLTPKSNGFTKTIVNTGVSPTQTVTLTGASIPSVVIQPEMTITFMWQDDTWLVLSTTAIGTVTSLSVATANGFAGTVATPTSTPVITILTTVVAGLVASNGAGALVSNGTVTVPQGGTGSTSFANDNSFVLTGPTGTSPLVSLLSGPAGELLISGGPGTAPTWLTSGPAGEVLVSGGPGSPPVWLTGPLGVAYGGTGDSSFSPFRVVFSGATATSPLVTIADGAAGTVLTSNGAGGVYPSWNTTGSVTDVSVATANGFSGTVATPTTTPVITISTTLAAGLVGSNGAGALVAFAGAVGVGQGGTGDTSFTPNSVIASGATSTSPLVTIADGAAGTVLTAHGAGVAPTFVAVPASGSVTSVSVVTANGFAGTVATPTTTPAITLSTTVAGGILASNGAGAIAANGTVQVVQGGTSAVSFADDNSLLLTGATGTSPLVSLTNGPANSFLESNGPGLTPVWTSPFHSGSLIVPTWLCTLEPSTNSTTFGAGFEQYIAMGTVVIVYGHVEFTLTNVAIAGFPQQLTSTIPYLQYLSSQIVYGSGTVNVTDTPLPGAGEALTAPTIIRPQPLGPGTIVIHDLEYPGDYGSVFTFDYTYSYSYVIPYP